MSFVGIAFFASKLLITFRISCGQVGHKKRMSEGPIRQLWIFEIYEITKACFTPPQYQRQKQQLGVPWCSTGVEKKLEAMRAFL